MVVNRDLWRKFKSKTYGDGQSMRDRIEDFLRHYVSEPAAKN